MHIYTQTNIHEHWSQQPIRRGVPISDDWQAPDWRQYDREESQRRTHIHAKTQDHTEQTAEHCHCGITTNRHMIYLEMSNRIHPIQGVPSFPAFHSHLFFLSSLRVVDRGSYTYRRCRYKNPLKQKDNPHLFPLHHNRIEPTPSQHIDFILWSVKSPELPSYKQNSISRYYHTYTKKQFRDNLSHQQPC